MNQGDRPADAEGEERELRFLWVSLPDVLAEVSRVA